MNVDVCLFPTTSHKRIANSPACDVGQLTIETLPDDALLYVFDFYLAQTSEVEAWHTLVHVCRRWRILVFGSPRRLNLRIKCTNETPEIKEKLDVWPALPIVIYGTAFKPENLKAAFEHHNRICQIKLYLNEIYIASLEEPFPILTDLDLDLGSFELFRSFEIFHRSFDPDLSKFFGGPGSAHLLRSLTLREIRIPDLLKLLQVLATPNLVLLRLERILESFLPDEVITVLSSLTRLETLDLCIGLHQSHPDGENQRLPLLGRTVLPSLTTLKVTGDIEGLEDFMARIDTPVLDHLDILLPSFAFDRIKVLDTPQLFRFINHTPKLQTPVGAYIRFSANNICIFFLHSTRISRRVTRLKISCVESKQEIPCVAQFYRSLPLLLHPLEYLYICMYRQSPQNLTEYTRWLELLQPFTAVKNLYLTEEFAPHIAHSLQELVGERVMEVLPSLENVFIEEFEPSGPVYEIIKAFVVARQLAGRPLTISCWDSSTP